MPPPLAVADSDDDLENSLEPDDLAAGDDQAAMDKSAEGTYKQSTGSTERLRNQIRDAEHELFANTEEMAAPQLSSGSPSMIARKRRHSVVSSRQASLSPEKQLKRSKTQKTYSKQRSSAPRKDDGGNFTAFRDEEQAVAPSRSAKFSEHSAAGSSTGLPTGSIQADFLNHEPHLMFKDSGSTAVDNESSQLRMIEQARQNSRKGASTSASKLVVSEEQHKSSSSFPWPDSTGEQMQPVNKTPQARDQGAWRSENEQASPLAGPTEDDHTSPRRANDEQRPADAAAGGENVGQMCAMSASAHYELSQKIGTGAESTVKRHSSPRVEIAVQQTAFDTQTQASPPSDEMPSKRHRRKTQHQDSEPMNSEDQAIGLPRERYVPRPSKRRATHVEDEPIDFSMRPEKAAKAKRTKTASAAMKGDGAAAQDRPPLTQLSKKQAAQRDESSSILSVPAEKQSTAANAAKPDPALHAEKDATVEPELTLAESPDQVGDDQSLSKQAERDDDKIFVKPAPKLKSSAKSRRSHTTIFEDHMEFPGSQRSPSLSQQQANRVTALKDIENGRTTSTPGRRRKIIDEGDEDEDLKTEQGKAENQDQAQPNEALPVKTDEAPEKRGRGRPPKSVAKSSAKSAEKVLEDSDVEPSDGSEADQPPKKKAKGRPLKVGKTPATEIDKAETQAKAASELEAGDAGEEVKGNQSLAPDGANASATPVKQTVPGTQGPTPSPDKSNTSKASATPSKATAKAGPISHSPLKSSSKAPYRVGLSKRQRIPPLLRMMKPPKR